MLSLRSFHHCVNPDVMPESEATIEPADVQTGGELAPPVSSSVERFAVHSMTGQGSASVVTEFGMVKVELRSVNHRGFKCSMRLPEILSGFEGRIEAVARNHLHRGSINLSVHLETRPEAVAGRVNQDVLVGYLRQCKDAAEQAGLEWGTEANVDVGSLLNLPGVQSGQWGSGKQSEQLFAQMQPALLDAVAGLAQMRSQEGRNMGQVLLAETQGMRNSVAAIAQLAPRISDHYRQRLEGKVKRALAEQGLEIDPLDLLREVQIYADKTDISEELTRLDSHFELFDAVVCNGPESVGKSGATEPTGRRLDFIVQEMFRETNTIGSKGSDAQIAALVVDLKCGIERMRELVQNIE
ncbi:MAG: YicC family protein [Rhodopirellula sp. TMED11]|nr:MAG: YicC family protein [Rhodopirellula sp. TMED11]